MGKLIIDKRKSLFDKPANFEQIRKKNEHKKNLYNKMVDQEKNFEKKKQSLNQENNING